MKLRKAAVFFIICLVFNYALATSLVSAPILQNIKKNRGEMAWRRVKSWQDLVQKDPGLSVQEKLKSVNEFFNRFIYTSDQALVGQEDYWMTPLEFITKGAGDCEDFAIAKYFTLRALGIPDSQLQIIYVKSLKYNMAHMVLGFYQTPSSDPLILDSLTNQISPGSQRTELLPVYSFNAGGLWLSKARGMGQRVGSSDRLGKWEDMLWRMNQQQY